MDVECERVVTALRSEKAALSRVAYTIEVQRLVIDSARSDLMAHAGRDIEAAMAALRRADLTRAVTVTAAHVELRRELETLGVAADAFPTLGQIAAAARGAEAAVLLGLGEDLERLLARVVALADENRARLERMRRILRVGDDPDVPESDGIDAGVADRLSRFLEQVAIPDTPEELLDALEEAISEADPSVADALVQLRLQAVSFEAAISLLSSVGCASLLDFLREDHALAGRDADDAPRD